MKNGGTCFFWLEPPGQRFFATDPDLEKGPEGLKIMVVHTNEEKIPCVLFSQLDMHRFRGLPPKYLYDTMGKKKPVAN